VTDWFRSWHGAPTDPKWLLIAKRANVRPIHVIGTWWALLDFASQHSERGSIDGFDTETFALFAGLEDEHVSRIVTTLRDKGLIEGSRIAQWGKRQPKREDETASQRKRDQREREKENGGNPPSGGTPGKPHRTLNGSGHAMSRNVTPEERREENSSVANATGTVVPHPASDFCKAVFDSGRAILTQSGMDARRAGSLIGRWRNALGDAELLILIRQSESEGHSDPAAWLTAAVETRNGTRQNVRGRQPRASAALALKRAAQQAQDSSPADYGGDHIEPGTAVSIWRG
jgi:hypothetical protein